MFSSAGILDTINSESPFNVLEFKRVLMNIRIARAPQANFECIGNSKYKNYKDLNDHVREIADFDKLYMGGVILGCIVFLIPVLSIIYIIGDGCDTDLFDHNDKGPLVLLSIAWLIVGFAIIGYLIAVVIKTRDALNLFDSWSKCTDEDYTELLSQYKSLLTLAYGAHAGNLAMISAILFMIFMIAPFKS